MIFKEFSKMDTETKEGCVDCLDKKTNEVPTENVQNMNETEEPVMERPHRFNNQTFAGLHWCGFCGHFLWGLMLQGVKCQDCGFMAHRQCSLKVPNDCCPDLKNLQS